MTVCGGVKSPRGIHKGWQRIQNARVKANAPGNAGDMLTTRDFNGKDLQVSFQMEGRREMDAQSMRANQRNAIISMTNFAI